VPAAAPANVAARPVQDPASAARAEMIK